MPNECYVSSSFRDSLSWRLRTWYPKPCWPPRFRGRFRQRADPASPWLILVLGAPGYSVEYHREAETRETDPTSLEQFINPFLQKTYLILSIQLDATIHIVDEYVFASFGEMKKSWQAIQYGTTIDLYVSVAVSMEGNLTLTSIDCL
jgi:hypothetical protein